MVNSNKEKKKKKKSQYSVVNLKTEKGGKKWKIEHLMKKSKSVSEQAWSCTCLLSSVERCSQARLEQPSRQPDIKA